MSSCSRYLCNVPFFFFASFCCVTQPLCLAHCVKGGDWGEGGVEWEKLRVRSCSRCMCTVLSSLSHSVVSRYRYVAKRSG